MDCKFRPTASRRRCQLPLLLLVVIVRAGPFEHRKPNLSRQQTDRRVCIANLPILCYDTSVSETLTIRLGGDLAEALREEARLTGMARGEIARQALRTHLRGGGKLRAMKRYFGVVRRPADLSTNKAYRRTWGKKTD